MDRDTALLTKKQREYLRGESDIEPSSSYERAMRSRIRDRLYNSIWDLDIIWGSLEPRDIEHTFDRGEVFNDAGSAFAVLFDGLSRASRYEEIHPGEESSLEDFDDTIDMFSHYVEQAMEAVYVRRGFNVKNVDVDIDIEFGEDLSKITDRDFDELSREELYDLVRAGEISLEEFQDVYDNT